MARVVLIDDDHSLRELTADLLAAAGHETTPAEGGAEGLDAIRSIRPDLVICDVQMAGMDGYAVLDAVRSDPELATTPFLFMTGLDPRRHFRAAMNLGADDYLAKPVTPAALAAAVEARLKRRELSRREAERRVEEVKRSVSLLLPHELRTPLTVILGGSELLQELPEETGRQEVAEMAAAISMAARRLHRMAENYLLHAGMELDRLAGGVHVRPLAGTTAPAVVAEAARAAAREHGREHDLKAEIADVTLPIAEPYSRKIVAELADNALKFSEAGRPVRVVLERAERTVTLAVADEGRGMSPTQVRMIDAFRQFDRALYEQQGSGLGLAIVKGVVAVSGGRLHIMSAVGGGTTVQAAWVARG